MEIIERNKKFYTKDGLDALLNRVNQLIKIYNDNAFPFEKLVYGFGKLSIKNREECLHRLYEICDLIGFEFNLVSEIVALNDGTTIERRQIEG